MLTSLYLYYHSNTEAGRDASSLPTQHSITPEHPVDSHDSQTSAV